MEKVVGWMRYARFWDTIPRLFNALCKIGYARQVSKNPVSNLYHDERYFKFTGGRFITNEQYEMSQRYVRFDMQELARLAAEAVGSKYCVRISKYPDSMYNKVFLMTMDDNVEVVAKVPNPNAGPSHFTTASEVATMDFVRNIFKTPVPEVYAWSSRAKDNPVGAEYIIMEKLSGVPLGDMWPKMGTEDRFTVVKAITFHQMAWTSISFQQYGSLYYTQDLDGHTYSPLQIHSQGVTSTDHKFAVGPCTGRGFCNDNRMAVQFDRGPWDNAHAYYTAIGHREKACIESLPQLPRSPLSIFGPGTYQPTKEKKLRGLEYYLSMIDYLLPTDQAIQASFLMHGDLHAHNIFVDPEHPAKVTGIIDWQSTALAPLIEHARHPHLLDFEGSYLVGLERPKMEIPENKAESDASERAVELYTDQMKMLLYRTILHKKNPLLYKALAFRDTQSYEFLRLGSRLLVDGEALYLGKMVEKEEVWKDLPGLQTHDKTPSLFDFSEEQVLEILTDYKGAILAMKNMSVLQNAMSHHFPDRGLVPEDKYDAVKVALQQYKPQIIDRYARNSGEREVWQQNWPFDDDPMLA